MARSKLTLPTSIYYVLKESFWFLPALMALAAAVSSVAIVALDHSIGSDWLKGTWLLWSGGAEGARSVLSVIAGSTMTVVSIVFSITITALAQTSSHFGPRVLRNFTRDRGNQAVLGVFVATFLFSLLVLRTVRSDDGEVFVPFVAVNIGIALAVLSLAVLIYFIHHIATSIQADLLIARVGGECLDAVEQLFPEKIGHGVDKPPEVVLPQESDDDGGDVIEACEPGYLQTVDADALFDSAQQLQGVITLLQHPGRFVIVGLPLARVTPAGRLNDDARDDIRSAFKLGARRNPEQDMSYLAQQLVEIAARALSPGINEPFTAMLCIDWLGATLRSLAGRKAPSPLRADDSGKVRVVGMPVHFHDLVRETIGMIRRYAKDSPDVQVALLRTMRDLGPHVQREADRAVLLDEVRQLGLDALAERNEHDRSRVLGMMREARQALRRETAIATSPTEEH